MLVVVEKEQTLVLVEEERWQQLLVLLGPYCEDGQQHHSDDDVRPVVGLLVVLLLLLLRIDTVRDDEWARGEVEVVVECVGPRQLGVEPVGALQLLVVDEVKQQGEVKARQQVLGRPSS